MAHRRKTAKSICLNEKRLDWLFTKERIYPQPQPDCIKRPTKIICSHCPTMIWSARHLFRDCPYATSICSLICKLWQTSISNAMRWPQIYSDRRVPLRFGRGVAAEQIWTIIRGCMERVIWLERNLRGFNNGNPKKPWQARANQAGLDIQAHIESGGRR